MTTLLTESFISEEYINQINAFQCKDKDGDNQVQIFLHEQALELMQKNLVRTRLFFDENQNLIGFFSLFNDTIKMNKKKREELQISLPSEVKEIPAIRLHYLGVDNGYRGRGFGYQIMSSVLTNCIKVAKVSGCTLITLESTNNAVEFYKKFDFMYIRPEQKYKLLVLNTKNLLKLIDD